MLRAGGHPFLVRRLGESVEYRRELEAALRVGISLRRWRGWEPAEVTEHEYDQDGRLVRSVSRREAEWTNESRADVLAYLEWESRQCKGCGGDLTETTKPEHENRYVAQLPVRCWRCDEREAANDIIFDPKHGHPRPRALMVPIEFTPPEAVQDDD